jgi:rfaE bifunctional protein nucleotidyltransferase chain/domain/rfaE bifunctional protein kinase chain/domain
VIAPLVVLGDVILDVDLLGRSDRVCPDDPALVVDTIGEQRRPGGAALTAWLAAGHGVDVVLVCPLAHDDDAATLLDLLADRVRVVGVPSTGSTAVKSRVRVAGRTLLRLDRGGDPGCLTVDPQALQPLLDGASAVLVSDYGRGLAADPQVRALLEQAAEHVPVVWDPHPRGAEPVPGTWLATPNAAEVAAWTGATSPGRDLRDEIARARSLHQRWACRHVAVTLGARGAALVPASGTPLVAPADPVAGDDSCGAGDAFAAAVAVCLARGATAADAVRYAVDAAGRFVGDGAASAVRSGRPADAGPTQPDPADLRPAARADEHGTAGDERALRVVEQCRAAGGRVVMAGGCFDLLHAGHVEYLEAARRLGDCLVVALNGDESLRRLKGDGRPLVPAPDRARIVAALGCVDAVVVFDEATPAETLRRLRPDVFAKGGDYLGAELPEADVVDEVGGQVVALPLLPGRSTTRLAQALDVTPLRKDSLSCSAL